MKEQYLNENDNMKVEIEELELLLGPADSEVDLRKFLRYARRKMGGRIFDIFSSKGQSEFLVDSRARWEERQMVLVTQEEESRGKAQEVDHEVKHGACVSLLGECHTLAMIACNRHRPRWHTSTRSRADVTVRPFPWL